MKSWPDHLPSGNQKRRQRDPEQRADSFEAISPHYYCAATCGSSFRVTAAEQVSA